MKKQKCPDGRFRNFDGRCNNLENANWGAVQAPFRRLIPPAYEDGILFVSALPRISSYNQTIFEYNRYQFSPHFSHRPTAATRSFGLGLHPPRSWLSRSRRDSLSPGIWSINRSRHGFQWRNKRCVTFANSSSKLPIYLLISFVRWMPWMIKKFLSINMYCYLHVAVQFPHFDAGPFFYLSVSIA